MQYELTLIDHKIKGELIPQRHKDGYINATAMCRAAGKEWSNYRKANNTQEFFDELESDLQIGRSELIESISGGDFRLQGTWVHPHIAVHLAQWLSPKFAVKVSKWVQEWMSGGGRPTTSYHLRRYASNLHLVPHTHFSMLQEMMVRLIGPMEARGYVLPENLIPDISEGRMFCKFLRDDLSVDTDALPTYPHRYEDGRIVYPKLYPIDLLPAFIRHFNEVWLPNKAVGYFGQRDPEALEYLTHLLASPTAA
jgi:hypothetical protein